MFDISKSRFGLIQGDKIIKLFGKYLGNQKIEDLEVPLAVGATDFSNGQRVIIVKGSLVDAIRASISVPVLFAPYFHPVEEKWLVDGGFKISLWMTRLDSIRETILLEWMSLVA